MVWHDLKLLFVRGSQTGIIIANSGLSVFPKPQSGVGGGVEQKKCSARVEEIQPETFSIGWRGYCPSTGPAGSWPGR